MIAMIFVQCKNCLTTCLSEHVLMDKQHFSEHQGLLNSFSNYCMPIFSTIHSPSWGFFRGPATDLGEKMSIRLSKVFSLFIEKLHMHYFRFYIITTPKEVMEVF